MYAILCISVVSSLLYIYLFMKLQDSSFISKPRLNYPTPIVESIVLFKVSDDVRRRFAMGCSKGQSTTR